MRVSEIYLSIQGEGPRVGSPTVFVRFGGCNLRCPAWPCDTQHAIDPAFRSEWRKMVPSEVVEEVGRVAAGFRKYNVCYTGGEPFLQPDQELWDLTTLLHQQAQVEIIECFSNGTLTYPDWAPGYIHFVMDWKLPGSGEYGVNENIRLDNVRAMRYYGHAHSIKFTIADYNDYLTAEELYDKHGLADDFNVFAGVVWGKLTNEKLVEWMLEDRHQWKLNVQVHNHIWDREKRGI